MDFVTIASLIGGLAVVSLIAYQIIVRSKYRGMRFNWLSFKKKGEAMGLEKPEIIILRDLAYAARLRNFNSIYTSERTLDGCLRVAINQLRAAEMNDNERQSRIENIFLLRNKIDLLRMSRKQGLKSTLKLKVNQHINLTFERIGTYESQVLDVNPTHFAVAMPLEALNTEEFSWKGKKATAVFYVDDDGEYHLASKVIDQAISANIGLLHIAHTDKLTRMQKRMYRRNSANISVDIYTLKIASVGSTRKISVANQTPFNGLIVDISAGGVAIRAGGVLKENTLIKLDFSLDLNTTESAIGRVLCFHQIDNSADKMLHIKFERLTKKTRNRIFEYIYLENKDNENKPVTIMPTEEGMIIPSDQTSMVQP